MSLLKLFILFVKIGAILLGGGYVILPILKSEFVEKHQLISEEDLINYFAISQSLPGIIAANISIFVGYKLFNLKGAIIAVLGIVFTPFWTIVLLASILSKITHTEIAQGVFWGIGIGVIVLLFSATKEIWQKSIIDAFSFLLFLFALLALTFSTISPAIIIISSAIMGIVYKIIIKKEGKC